MRNEETTQQVKRAQAGDLEAFNWIVRRFQDRAVGYAGSVLGHTQSAQDAAQDAFVEAYLTLPTLRSPEAFSGWFRKIIFKHCNRQTRKLQIDTVPIEEATQIKSPAPELEEVIQQQELQATLSRAIQSLPPLQREVVTLFYRGQHSHQEIAEFLGLSVSTVKSRLHQGRSRLRKQVISMEEEQLQTSHSSNDDTFVARVNKDIALALTAIAADSKEGRQGLYASPHPVYGLMSSLLLWAIEAKALEIHLVPEAQRVLVQFKFKEALEPMMSLPKSLQEAVLLRFKVAGEIEDLQAQKPQTGMIPVQHAKIVREVILRSWPTDYGEQMTVTLGKILNSE